MLAKKSKSGLSFGLTLAFIAILLFGCTSPTAKPLAQSSPLPATEFSASKTPTTGEPTLTSEANPQPTFTLQPTDTFTLSPTETFTASPTETYTIQPTANLNPLQITFFDVGQGDSILIVSPNGKNMLIDGGEPDTGIVQYLQDLKIGHIDVMVATHPHSDHIGGLVQVLKTIPVTEVITNGEPTTTNIYEQFLDAIASAKAKYTEVKKGDTIPLGDLSFDVLSPATATGDLNSDSIVLRLTYGKTSVMFMGDADAAAESAILASGSAVKADILKVGHHGSKYSSSVAFLKAVSPAVAVYSAGLGNSYGHPAPQTIASLQNVGAQIYGTDKDGTITVTIDADGYKINPSKIAARAPPAPTEVVIVAPTLLSLEIVSVTSPVAPGSKATLTAKTLPGAQCTIIVYYLSGPSKASGLNLKNADITGTVSWTWKVGTNTTRGSWRIVVVSSLFGKSVAQETHFTVQ